MPCKDNVMLMDHVMVLYLMLEKIRIFRCSCSDLKSRNKASAVRIGGGVEDERLDAGHRVEAGEDEHEGQPKEEHIQLFHLGRRRNTLKRRSTLFKRKNTTKRKHVAERNTKRRGNTRI